MKYIIIVFVSVIFCTDLLSCSFASDSFCTTVNTANPDNIILRGYFSQVIDNGLIFTRLETLRGQEDRSEVTIWDNLPFDCNGIHERLASFLGNLDEEVIISVAALDTFIFNGELEGDYRVPPGIWWQTHSLKILDDEVIGFINPNEQDPFNQEMDYDDFKEDIIVNGQCSVTNISEAPNSLSIKIYPTPTKEILNLDYSDIFENLNFELYDMPGRQILNSRIQPRIDLARLEAGMYVVVIRNKGRIVFTQKIIKI